MDIQSGVFHTVRRLAIIDESPTPKPSRQALAQGTPAAAAPREVHLRVEVVAAEFEGMSVVNRQRRVYQVRGCLLSKGGERVILAYRSRGLSHAQAV